ncbi:MAG: GGDEF domain-containing protein [Micrococcales bacterium]|nr:GGDEF domain-containing protein [Micrococcales bacterium]
MRFLLWMQPRSRSAARSSMVVLAGVAVLVTVVFLPVQTGARNPTPTELLLLLVAVAVVLLGCWAARNRPVPALVAWAVVPLLSVVAIVVLDLLTSDVSVAAQVFFVFPTLYGASQLRRPGAVVMTVASVVGVGVVVLGSLPLAAAVADLGYVTAALVTTAVLLVRSGERQDELVTRLERLAAVDPLTGLATRRVLDEAARSAISGADSAEGTSLILLDVDEFKSVNDRYGHPGGDEVLVQLAEYLVRSARRDDIVSRLGGDEMAVLLPGCSKEALQRRAEQIVADVRAHTFVLHDGQAIRVSVSIGLANVPVDAADLQGLYVRADQALYEAKRSGRNRVGVLATPPTS